MNIYAIHPRATASPTHYFKHKKDAEVIQEIMHKNVKRYNQGQELESKDTIFPIILVVVAETV